MPDMDRKKRYAGDFQTILAKRHHLGGDFWTTPDLRIGKGSPFSARDVALLLGELGFGPRDDIVRDLADES